MDEHFESNLKHEVKQSYQIKTTSQDILSAYHAQKEVKKSHSYKAPFYTALGAFACAAIALAIYIPISLNPKTPSVTSGDPIDSLSEINVSPLGTQEETLTYEASSLYPLLKKTQALRNPTTGAKFLAAKQRANSDEDEDEATSLSTEERFEQRVDAYEKVEPSVYDAFNSNKETYTVSKGSFVYANVTYSYKSVLGETGTLYYNLTYTNAVWSTMAGVLVDGKEALYTLKGKNLATSGYNDIELSLLSSEDDLSVTVTQRQSQGVFYFSYSVFEDLKLEYTFSISLLQASSSSKAVVAKYYLADDSTSGTFRVLRDDSTHFSLYGDFFGKISLSYENNERVYSYGDYVITED
jgi:hypothetical protein